MLESEGMSEGISFTWIKWRTNMGKVSCLVRSLGSIASFSELGVRSFIHITMRWLIGRSGGGDV